MPYTPRSSWNALVEFANGRLRPGAMPHGDYRTLNSYVSQARRVFREPVRTGKAGRPRLVLPAALSLYR